jgi:hypothetical protein
MVDAGGGWAAPDDPFASAAPAAAAAAFDDPTIGDRSPMDHPTEATSAAATTGGRRRRGVPMDAGAPAMVRAQASSTRSAGSGEWNRSRSPETRRGWRRILPGMIPPVALAAIGLFVVAGILFLMPGFFIGGETTPPPALPSASAAAPAGSGGPVATEEPLGTPAPGSTFEVYVVESGDTLIDIARRFAVSQEVLICANRELRRNPDLLSVGQELQIPPPDFQCPRANRTPRPTKAP